MFSGFYGSPVSRRRFLTTTAAAVLAAGTLAGTTLVTGSGTAAAGDAPHPKTFLRTGQPGEQGLFHWGVATSGFQVEGDNRDSNWSRYATDPKDPDVDPVGNAADFRHRYKEDIANAASLGVNTFRFGVEWARIEPHPGQFDQKEIAYYDDVVKEIRSHGMVPMITMMHYVYPGWVEDNGGITSDYAAEHFQEYANFITDRWGGNDTMWITLNEPFVFFGHDVEIGIAQATDLPKYIDTIVRLNKIGHDAAHKADPKAQTGTNYAFLPTIAPVQREILQKRVEPDVDFVGIDFYYSVSASNLSAINAAFGDFAKVTPEPEGIYYALRQYHELFPTKPLYVVENGMPTDNGAPRPDGYERGDYLHDTVYWLQRAKADGIPLIGYNHWSLVDNYEWGDYSSRFGLWTVNIKDDPTLKRTPTPAVDTYRDIIANDGVRPDAKLNHGPSVCSFDALPSSCTKPADPNGPREPLLAK